MFLIDSIIFFCIRICIQFVILPTVKITFFILECLINVSKRITFYFLPKQTFPCRIFERIELMYSRLVERYRGILQSISDWILSDSPKRIVSRIKELKAFLFLFVLTVWFLSTLITVLYANTYYDSPTKKFDFPFYFDYTYHGLPLSQVMPYPTTKEIIQFDSFETATILPHAFIDMQELDIKLGIGEYYDVSIEIELPESYANRDAGVFMLNLTLYAENTTLIATAGRPLLLKYKSNFLTYIQTFVFFPFYFLGLLQEKQTINSLMFENYQENFKLQTKAIYVSISSPKIEIYESSMHFSLKPQGLDRLILYWPWTAWLVMTALFMVSFCLLSVLILQAIIFIAIDIVHTRLPEVADMLPTNDPLMHSRSLFQLGSDNTQQLTDTYENEDFINMSPLYAAHDPLDGDIITPPTSPAVYVERECLEGGDRDSVQLRHRN